jgi:DNA-binding HxlR family transcriptional regulator
MPGTHPRFGLDEAIHAPVRLSIMAALDGADRVDFAFLRDSIEVSDSLLSKHMAHLERAGYVAVTKGYERKRPRTWFSLTEAGQGAFHDYATVLAQLIGHDQHEQQGVHAPEPKLKRAPGV